MIPVSSLIGHSLHTREAAQLLINCAANSPCNEVELDFDGVDFISRSFAHQFHFDKIEAAIKHSKVIIVTNASEPVLSMLQAVAKASEARQYKMCPTQVFKFTKRRQMERMILAFK
jgi:hypothetical protein